MFFEVESSGHVSHHVCWAGMFGCLTAGSNYISSTVPCQRCPPPACTHTLSHSVSHTYTHTHAFSLPTTPFLSVYVSFSHTCSQTQTTLYNMQHIINLTLSFHTEDKQTLPCEGMEPKLPCQLLHIRRSIYDGDEREILSSFLGGFLVFLAAVCPTLLFFIQQKSRVRHTFISGTSDEFLECQCKYFWLSVGTLSI